MKTAIEKIKEAYTDWCFNTEQGERVIHADLLDSLIKEGLEIEKQQIIDAYKDGWDDGVGKEYDEKCKPKQYFKRIFEKKIRCH